MQARDARGGVSDRPARERHVRRLLAERGLIRSRARRAKARDPLAGGPGTGARLRVALEELGPLFGAFGDYLSSRVDLIPLHDCLALAPGAGRLAPARAEAVRDLLVAEFPSAGPEGVPDLEAAPFQASRTHQWHRARLAGGEPVTLKILRPQFEEQALPDLDLLPLLGEIDTGDPDWEDAAPGETAEDFGAAFLRRLDLRAEAAALAEMAAGADGFEALAVPALFPDLCSRRVVTTADWPGTALGLRAAPADGGEPHGAGDLARKLSLGWLQQALLGGIFPEEPGPENLRLLPDGRLLVTGGPFARLESGSGRDLLSYLAAVARQDPDRALAFLLRETRRTSDAVSREDLRLWFRQAEPFRAAGWSDHYSGGRLADTLFIQWRLARRGGRRPNAGLLSFCRGLHAVESLARSLDPGRDAFRGGLDDLRVVAAAVHLRQAFGPSGLRRNIESFLPRAMEAVQRIDELSLAAERGGAPGGSRSAAPGGRGEERRRNRRVLFAGLLLLAVSVALFAARMLAPQADGAAAGPAGAAALLLAGAAVLLAAGRE